MTSEFSEEELKAIFKLADRNDDGKIDIQEINIDHFTKGSLRMITQTDFTKILNEHDSDKDGKISYAEFKAAFEKAYPNEPE
jgi:Ca2+-binding EF-hand superfamily protein